jgi:hypothetical protein
VRDPQLEIIEAFGELMERYPTAILDISKLPASKQEIKRAIKEAWFATSDDKLRNFLAIAYIHLSQFQHGVGNEPVDCGVPKTPDAKSIERLDLYLRFAKMAMQESNLLKHEFDDFREHSKEPVVTVFEELQTDARQPFFTTTDPREIVTLLAAPFVELWQGDESLPKAFWLFFVVGSILAPLAAGFIYIPFGLAGMQPIRQPLAVFGMIVYPLFAAVGVWRSANARPFRKWPIAAAAAKFGVGVWLLMLAGRIARMSGYHL